MTIQSKNIFNSLNKYLSLANAFIWGLFTTRPLNYEKIKVKKIPIIFNLLLFVLLICLVFIMTYGSYRRQTD